ncbi:hypothetical protein E8E13_002933 [Curvularia kusanoi]|uniref:Uncharacterized protein n=1 Tax=Curvularia kusanoi TaxID=90978 RepID=A0A9P4T5K0_CURKU|nr:hypothetical protein E8E13_002933 [Curvularia kusanoi]
MTPLVNALWESQKLTLTFDHIALSLTNQLRNAASNASHVGHALGVTQRWETHVRVQWPYLAFPASMITIGITYVLLTIVQSGAIACTGLEEISATKPAAWIE